MAEKDFRVPVFRRAIRGYAPEHVDAFIAAVQDKYYSLIAENDKLRARISEITADNKKRGFEEEMRRHEIEQIREEAERLLGEAKNRADRLIREAETEAGRIRDEAVRTREDADIYAEEARTEAIEMLKERDAMLSRAAQTVSELREKLAGTYGDALSALDEFGQVDPGKEASLFDRAEKTARAEEETAFAPTVPDYTEIPEDTVPPDVIPEEEEKPVFTEPQTDEIAVYTEQAEAEGTEPVEDAAPEEEEDGLSDEITIPDFSPVFEEDGEEEETEGAGGREGFPFAFDENDYYRTDAPEEPEEEEDGSAEEDEWAGEDEESEDDELFSDAVPDFISDYPDVEQTAEQEESAGVPEDAQEEEPEDEPEDESEDEPEESSAEEFELLPEEVKEEFEEEEREDGSGEVFGEMSAEEFGFFPEEKEGSEEGLQEDEPEDEDENEQNDPEAADFDGASSETYRDYDLDEILKGLEYMTNEKAENAVGSAEGLPDDADIVDALKKKFGDVADAELPEDGENGSDKGDFYEDEEHEDGESFDPNSFLRFRK